MRRHLHQLPFCLHLLLAVSWKRESSLTDQPSASSSIPQLLTILAAFATNDAQVYELTISRTHAVSAIISSGPSP